MKSSMFELTNLRAMSFVTFILAFLLHWTICYKTASLKRIFCSNPFSKLDIVALAPLSNDLLHCLAFIASGIIAGGDPITTASTGVKIQNDALKCFNIVDEKLHWNDQALEVQAQNSLMF